MTEGKKHKAIELLVRNNQEGSDRDEADSNASVFSLAFRLSPMEERSGLAFPVSPLLTL